mmetsp:Transcript_30149/g.70342  ORF Transcript_30149/g.70342 Transcript_30149/m.70342 type:complete len:165 (-) Transcript_30149:53-547(-)
MGSPAVGDSIEAYWPDDDMWLAATFSGYAEDGSMSITWEDGSTSDVPADYIRCVASAEPAAAEPATAKVAEPPASAVAAAGGEADMDALLAAAEAAGACDAADKFVEGTLPPSEVGWSDTLKKARTATDVQESADEARKRCRPLGLMSSTQAIEMALAAKKQRK